MENVCLYRVRRTKINYSHAHLQAHSVKPGCSCYEHGGAVSGKWGRNMSQCSRMCVCFRRLIQIQSWQHTCTQNTSQPVKIYTSHTQSFHVHVNSLKADANSRHLKVLSWHLNLSADAMSVPSYHIPVLSSVLYALQKLTPSQVLYSVCELQKLIVFRTVTLPQT